MPTLSDAYKCLFISLVPDAYYIGFSMSKTKQTSTNHPLKYQPSLSSKHLTGQNRVFSCCSIPDNSSRYPANIAWQKWVAGPVRSQRGIIGKGCGHPKKIRNWGTTSLSMGTAAGVQFLSKPVSTCITEEFLNWFNQ